MRWHAPGCCQPEVYVADDDVPTCKSCGKSASQMQRPEEDGLLPLFSIPPDEPAGELNLSWPPCVPYSTNASATQPGEDATGEASPRQDPRISESCDTDDSSWRSHIYETTLSPNEFRIACLEAIPGGSRTTYPVHLSFDVFQDDHHPDYDTVSYTWGGEDDDKTQSFPIYIGGFWDVLYATRNCQSVLRYLRPFRGTRLIWLDFICINQRNMHEKSHQVAKMGQIYSQCNQATVWLGEDIVSHDQAALPSVRQLEEDEYLQEIITRRYFTRVWVIQELVLSPRLAMPFRDVVIRIGPLDIVRSRQETLENSQAPWFRFATQGIKEMSQTWENSWIEAMYSTSTAKSSDLRDSLYGVMGLWPSGKADLIADYSISYQHMMIGLFAYRLIHHHESELLWAARGIDFPELGDATPSWAPPFQMQGFWQWLSHRLSPYSGGPPREYRSGREDENDLDLATARPWLEQATVDSKTGGLFLRAVKVLSIPSGSQNNKPLEQAHLYLLGDIEDQELALKNGADVFCLGTSSASDEKVNLKPMYFLLRRMGPQKYRLLRRVLGFVPHGRSPSAVPIILTLGRVREKISFCIAILKNIWNTPMRLLGDNVGMRKEFSELLTAFPGHHETPFHELLPAILGARDPGYLLENPSARRREARLGPVRAYPDGALILRFTGPDRADIRKPLGGKKSGFRWPKWDCYYDQRDPEINAELEHMLPWAAELMDLRWEDDIYAACPMSLIMNLLIKIKTHLDIGAIWKSLDTVNPEGSWSELLQAESLYPKNLVDLGRFRDSNSSVINRWQITAAEQRIEII